MDSIKCRGLVEVANVRKAEHGQRHNFKTMVAYVTPLCPVAKKKSSHSKSTRVLVTKAGTKPDIAERDPKTGVKIFWHSREERRKLSQA